MRLQAVFFDMGGTLERLWHERARRLEVTPGLRDCLLAAGIRLDLSDRELCERVSAGYDAYRQRAVQTTEELPPEQVWSEFIFAGLSIDGSKLAAAADNLMFYLESNFYQRQPRPEVPAVLEAIRDMGLKIGLISNVCSRALVPQNLERYGIRQYFDPLVLSSIYGRRKPDPAIFHHAARLAEVPTSACVYVGDRISRDVIGARRAGYGMAVQIINEMDQGEDDDGAQPDAVICNMTELLDLIRHEDITPHAAPESGPGGTGIRAVLFDAGDILYHRPRGPVELDAFLKRLGIARSDALRPEREELKKRAFNGSITQAEYRRAVLRLYGVTDAQQIESGSAAIAADEASIEFFDGVAETLIALKRSGFLLGIITDSANPIHVKLGWFERGGFGHVWDTIISSRDEGVEKPEPRIYQAALRQLGVAPGQAVFVGHSPEELEGARAIGMKTVAFNYEAASRADVYIHNFRDLASIPLLAPHPVSQGEAT